MNFATTREAVRLSGDAGVTSCVWGHRGIGKSQMIRQLAEAGIGEVVTFDKGKVNYFPSVTKAKKELPDAEMESLPMGFIDFRLGQIEASDLRGLPDKDKINGVVRTVYRTPSELPVADMDASEIHAELEKIKDPIRRAQRELELQPHYKEGYLFLDEPNRAQDDVLQAVFQLILDRRIGQYQLPAGWRIVMAANYMEGTDYITNGFTDAAFLDRFCHLTLSVGENTLDEWLAYMANNHGEDAAQVMDYCASNLAFLHGKVSGQMGFNIQPSPRSWEAVCRVSKVAAEKNYAEESHIAVVSGLVGMECAQGYIRYSCPVKPRDIIRDGVKRHTKKLVELERGQLMGLSWGLVSMVTDKLDNKDIVTKCLDFAEILLKSKKVHDKDVVVSFCRALIGDEGPMVACLTNRQLAEIISNIAGDTVNLFFKELQQRTKLHELVSNAGWGKVE